NQSASVYNQGWTMKHVKALSLSQLKHEFEYIQRTLERSNLHNFKRTTFMFAPSLESPSAKRARLEVPQDVLAASSQVPASVPAVPSVAVAVLVPADPLVATDVSVPAVPPDPAVDYAHVDTEVHADESNSDDTTTASEQVSAEYTVAAASDSDDDPLPYAPYAGWEMVPSSLGSIHAYYDMEGHTKHFTSLRELLHMVEKNDLRRLLGAVDNLYQREDPDTFSLRFWRLYPRAQVHVLETVNGRVIYMFVDVSYPLSAATLQRMLKHGLEVPKLLIGGDLTMAIQLFSFSCWCFTTQQMVFRSSWFTAKKELTHHEELASPEQTATGKDVSNPFMAVMVCQKPLGYFSSPLIHAPRAGLMLLFHVPAVFDVPDVCSCWFPHFLLFLIAAVWLFAAVSVCSCCWNKDAILELTSEDLYRILKLTLSNSRLGEDCWELQN
nr:aminoacyl-tRNA synthetase, class 1a, anticodon-binding [Tanacetum cinerariifolium]